jgi:hypothetical protein
MRPWWRIATRTLVVGTVLGLLILGIGGRLVMAWITTQAGGTPRYTLGGTTTVILLGAVSGFAGAVMWIVSRGITARFLTRFAWSQYVLLGAMLLLVTMRGLRGTAQAGSSYFYLLVALYGIGLVWFTRTARRAAALPQSQRPRPLESE